VLKYADPAKITGGVPPSRLGRRRRRGWLVVCIVCSVQLDSAQCMQLCTPLERRRWPMVMVITTDVPSFILVSGIGIRSSARIARAKKPLRSRSVEFAREKLIICQSYIFFFLSNK